MANLGSKVISQHYQKLLQISESGVVADGSGSYTSLSISGSEYYTSASANDMLLGIGVTGSIVPEGDDKWDLGSPDNPFRHIFVSNNSIVFVESGPVGLGQSREKIRLTKDDIFKWQTGDMSATRDATTKQRITPIASNIKTTGVEPFLWDVDHDLVSNNLTNLHIVSDRFWVWNSNLNELEPKSIMFGYDVGSSPSNELVIGG